MVPIITISLYHLCRDLLKPTHTRKKEKANSWIEVQQSFVSHLLFVDDNLVFSRASTVDCKNLKKAFDVYIVASGQIFDYEKSSMFFSNNKNHRQMDEIKSIFNSNVVSRHEKYIGLPSMVGRKNINFFNDVKLRVLNKLTSWQSKFFSYGGKEVFIKVVPQVVLAYAMSVFKVPQSICEDIQKAITRLQWGSLENHRSIHQERWQRLCHAKTRGGLVFRDFSSFKQALIAKSTNFDDINFKSHVF